jgi:hypothetical protein
VLWVAKTKGKGVEGREDPTQAAVYEQALKNRPTPFVAQLRIDGSKGTFRVGVNFASLIHRALSRLPLRDDQDESKIELSWRLTTDYHNIRRDFPNLTFTSNRHDASAAQPPNFKKYPLRPEQLRSLAWMMNQESPDAPPFIEEEISEAALDHLGWRAEGRATRAVKIRGGIVADQVGYGKTAITLGLIDSTQDKVKLPSEEQIPGYISMKATLIYVPGHLLVQWPDEVTKFMGSTKKVIVIKDLNGLNRTTIAELQKADIVIASSKIFTSQKYWENLEVLAAAGKLPANAKKGDRYFVDRYEKILESLRHQVALLKTGEGVSEVVSSIESALLKSAEEAAATLALVPSKRLVGKAFRDDAKSKSKNSDDDDGSEEEEMSSKKKNTKVPKLGKTVNDPWGLTTGDVRRDWRKMKSPAFEMFHWNRIVVDEFTYLDGRIHAAVLHLRGTFRWVLSGTPPKKDFHDIKSMAVFMGVHLGIDDETDFNSRAAKRRRQNATKVEQFHAFRETHTHEWHWRRHQKAQEFLNQFVRQNIAEIDEIISEEREIMVKLPPAERAIYMELEHHLQALDMNAKKAMRQKAHAGDRERRMMKALGKSISAEEALLKRCSHFDIDLDHALSLGGALSIKDAGKPKSKEKGKKKKSDSDDEDEELDEDDEEVVLRGKKRTRTAISDDEDDENDKSSGRSAIHRMTALETCDAIVNTRKRQLHDCLAELRTKMGRTYEFRKAVRARKDFHSAEFHDALSNWLDHGRSIGDDDANEIFSRIIDECGYGSSSREKSQLSSDFMDIEKEFDEADQHLELERIKKELSKPAKKSAKNVKTDKSKGKNKKRRIESDEEDYDDEDDERNRVEDDDESSSEADDDEHTKLMASVKSKNLDLLSEDLRVLTHSLRGLCKELTGRVRSLRFFEFVRNLLRPKERAQIIHKASFSCPGELCKNKESSSEDLPLDKIAVLSCCGHSGCADCLYLAANTQKCPTPGCGINVHDKAVVRASCLGNFGEDPDEEEPVSGEFGAKLMKLVDILKDATETKREKALVFVQFDGLMEKVAEALEAAGIRFLQIKGTAHQTSTTLHKFQKGGAVAESSSKDRKSSNSDDEYNVLLLKVDDESAAGANLTIANHVIFVGPVLTPTHELHESIETQAIGRARRYGQQRKVFIWRLLARETIDTHIYDKFKAYMAKNSEKKD